MERLNLYDKKLICPECFLVATMEPEDHENNAARLCEQEGIREKNEPFNFNFRMTCPDCGPVYLMMTIRNPKVG